MPSRRGRRRWRTSTGCSPRCWRSSSPTPSIPPDVMAQNVTTTLARAETLGRAPARGEGRLLDVGRRPVQGIDRLRGADRHRVRRDVRPRPRGPHHDDPHAADRRPRARRSRNCTASAARSPTRRACRCRAPGSPCPTPVAGPPLTRTAGSPSRAVARRHSTGSWHEPPTATRPRARSRSPAGAATSSRPRRASALGGPDPYPCPSGCPLGQSGRCGCP